MEEGTSIHLFHVQDQRMTPKVVDDGSVMAAIYF
jgi:hypothetical protein